MQCPHPKDETTYNITSQDAVWRSDQEDYVIQWCRWCGAYRTLCGTTWAEWTCPIPPRCRESAWATIFDGMMSVLVVTPLVLVALAVLWSACIKFTIWVVR